jgi:hypothetical protein
LGSGIETLGVFSHFNFKSTNFPNLLHPTLILSLPLKGRVHLIPRNVCKINAGPRQETARVGGHEPHR